MKLALFLVAATLCAQETVNNASLSVRVTDPSRATVENAAVTVRQTETNQTSTGLTDREGRFRFPYLRVGPYQVTVSKPGFAVAIRDASLSVGSAYDLEMPLRLGQAGDAVSVSDELPLIETARSQIAGTVSQTEAANLPLNGRNFLDLALLIPGVSPTNTGANQMFAETSAVPGQGISVGSQRNFSNSYIVDGLSANDDAAGLSGIFYGLDVVQEFQVVTSGGQSEFGRALGGYINVITKSGTNNLHGDLYGYFRNRVWNAANPLSHTVLPMTQAQYGASLGGPVIRDRTFFFANFEQRELNQSGLITIAPANITAINAADPAAHLFTGLFPNPVHNTNFLAKVDHQFSDKDQFNLRYSLYSVASVNSRGAGALGAATASANLDNTDQSIVLSNIRTFSPRLVNETRGQFTYSTLNAPPSDLNGPAVSISGVATFGTLSGSPTGRLNKLYEAVDNLSYQAGEHAVRAGVDFLYNSDTITFPRSFRGSYSFSSLANFLNGTYNNSGFTQTFGNPVVSQTNPNVGIYLQDEWKATARLTLNAGIRYDLQFLKTIQTDTNNISPRAGFAWTPFRSGNTVVRGSYGLFYDRVPLRALANALLSAGNTIDPSKLNQISLSLSPGQTGAPVFPNILGSLTIPAGVLFNFSTMDRRLQNAYSEQGSFEIEQRLSSRSTISVGYEHLRGLHLIASINQNVPTCAPAGSNNGCRPNSAIGNDSQYSSAGDSHYDGLHISFVERPVKWGSLRVSYTYSKALDDVGEFFFSSPLNNYNIWQDYGRSDDDQRHRLVFDGTAEAKRFRFTTFLQYYSALPFNITTGSNTIQGTAARATVSRNAGTGFDFFNVNARLSRTFPLTDRLRLEAIAEAFNVLNHVNGVSLNGVSTSSSFRQMTAAGDPRTLQLALRIQF